MEEERKQEIRNIFGMEIRESVGSCLGLPSMVDRSRRDIFSYIKDWVGIGFFVRIENAY